MLHCQQNRRPQFCIGKRFEQIVAHFSTYACPRIIKVGISACNDQFHRDGFACAIEPSTQRRPCRACACRLSQAPGAACAAVSSPSAPLSASPTSSNGSPVRFILSSVPRPHDRFILNYHVSVLHRTSPSGMLSVTSVPCIGSDSISRLAVAP